MPVLTGWTLLFYHSFRSSGVICCYSLDGLGPNAYEAFQASRDLRAVVNKVLRAQDGSATAGELSKTVSVSAQLMTPIQPMLVRMLCKINQSMKKLYSAFYTVLNGSA